MELRRAFAIVAAATVLTLSAGPGTAAAELDGEVTVSPTTVEPGGSLTISGACEDATTADFWYVDSNDNTVGGQDGVDGDSDGIATTLTVGASAVPGAYQAYMRCEGDEDDDAGRVSFTISRSGTNAGGGSMAEGDNTMILIGGGLLAGAAVVGAMAFQRRGDVGAS